MTDLTVLAIPGFFGSMAYEARYLARRAEREGPSAADYELRDTITSLTMGLGSLVVPPLAHKLFRNVALGRGRWARPLIAVGLGAAVVTTVADAYRRRNEREAGSVERNTEEPSGREPSGREPSGREPSERAPSEIGPSRSVRRSRWARRVAGSSAVGAIAALGVSAAATWAAHTTAQKLFARRVLPDLGGGPLGLAIAIAGWDFLYYWNHRLQHESRIMWAIHVVHHSSERYNLSTALRQPWADVLGMFIPYGVMSLLGVRPAQIERARQLNLLYQYWIHTETIRSLGPLEAVLNTPSHHRAHHGVNKRYLDRNHGSILIVWDKLFGTFEAEREDDPVVYGLTTNIETFNPLRVASHEHADIVRDVAASDTWRDRLGYVLRSPGWAYERRAARRGRGASPLPLDAVGAA